MSAKVYYYQATGRANVIRLALAVANIPFEDVYPNGGYPPSEEVRDGWRKLGGNTTTNVPMLEMPDGKVYTQSQAVLRAVGRMGGLMPKDDDGLYITDKLIEDAEDLRGESYKAHALLGATMEACENFVSVVLPLHLGNLERQLLESDGGFFIGDSLTLADVAVYDAVTNFGSDRVPSALEAFPELKAWRDRVEEHEGIKAYHASDAWEAMYKNGPETLVLPESQDEPES